MHLEYHMDYSHHFIISRFSSTWGQQIRLLNKTAQHMLTKKLFPFRQHVFLCCSGNIQNQINFIKNSNSRYGILLVVFKCFSSSLFLNDMYIIKFIELIFHKLNVLFKIFFLRFY